jgi:cytochrome c oxidase subunit 4
MSNETHSHHHILPLSTYLTVGTGLLVLTLVTVMVASIDLGPYNMVVAMLIACAKATCVALYFMHLRYDFKLYVVVFLGAIVFLALFIIFTLFDTMRRSDIYEIQGRPIRNQSVMYDANPAAGMADSLQLSTDSTVVDSLSVGSIDSTSSPE